MSIHEIPTDLMFYISGAQACSYLRDQQQLNLFADPQAKMDPSLYSVLCKLGFRRSGEYVYAPRCPHCQACLPVRIPVASYQPDRSQRRNWRRNHDLEATITDTTFREEHFELYRRYLSTRHAGGSMADPEPGQYQQFFTSSWSDTRYVEFRLHGQLVAIAVIDLLRDGLSAVYSFFDPAHARRGLGVYMVQWLIEETRQRGLSHLYLGYLVEECRKMAYKSQYRPLEIFRQGRWQALQESIDHDGECV